MAAHPCAAEALTKSELPSVNYFVNNMEMVAL
jgi:hypothetical protein